jgi:hypothetical protein
MSPCLDTPHSQDEPGLAFLKDVLEELGFDSVVLAMRDGSFVPMDVGENGSSRLH